MGKTENEYLHLIILHVWLVRVINNNKHANLVFIFEENEFESVNTVFGDK